MQKTINRVSSWADERCMEINCSKTQAILFSLSTVKEKVMLKLEDMPVPQVDNPTFLGVTLDTRLTSGGSCGKICEKARFPKETGGHNLGS